MGFTTEHDTYIDAEGELYVPGAVRTEKQDEKLSKSDDTFVDLPVLARFIGETKNQELARSQNVTDAQVATPELKDSSTI